MSIFYGIDSNYANNLFSSLGTGSGVSGLTGLLKDYSSIKSGTYGKLLQQYYSNTGDTTSTKGATGTTKNTNTESTSTKDTTSVKDPTSYTRLTKASTATSKDDAKTLSGIDKSTDNLKDSADALLKTGANSAFQKVYSTDSEGNFTRGYDSDKIYKAVKSFVDNYNTVMTDAADSKSTNVASDLKALQNTTKTNESALKAVGITIDDKGKLTLDETAFKKADMSEAKSLFNGTGSYAYQVSSKASLMNYHAEAEASKANTYTNSGSYSYNYSAGDLFSQMF